ncbi:DUF1793-domain-containing protein [Phellopilus nigrolimitatus]|nr:DUF1793-domain-containing protein [Phellopilus nigrolimitatus]
MLHVFFAFLLSAARVVAQNGPKAWSAAPFNPPSLPLAVKSPYVNIWAPQGNAPAPLNQAWPRYWAADLAITGWYASVRVDGTAYMLLGDATVPLLINANQTAVQFTPTRTSYILNAGPVSVNATFLSPIEPTDLARQSLPFSYFYLSVQSSDGKSHDVQVYSDVSGEWITGNVTLQAKWSAFQDNELVYLQMELASPGPYQEIDDHPQDATLYHSIKNSNSVSWQIGPADNIRSFFANGTGLNGQSEPTFHAVNFPYETLGIAVDLGSITTTNEPVVYAVGVVRDPVIRYTNAKVHVETRSAFYWSKFTNIHDAIEDVLNEFDDALSAAIALDARILGDGSKISSNYADLLALATRQAMGAFEYTLVKDSSGKFNMSDIKAFMKNLGLVGSGRINSVDVIYAALPVFIYLNPAIVGYLLSPLLDYQSSTQYQNAYAAQGLGPFYPIASGDFQGHNQKIEESANMLIMSLAHAQFSGDGTLIGQHYDLLNGWASFLVNNSMAPGDETTSSSDGISATNQTNLALKGILGISAMSKISGFTGRSDDQSHYQSVATQFAQQWTSLASASDGLVSSFGSGSSGIMYNLFADKLLQLNLIGDSVYNLQTSYCKTQASANSFGIPLDSGNSSLARSDWTMFAAAIVTDTSVRDSMISLLHSYASPNLENLPFAVMYNPTNGHQLGGINSPAQGAMFAPLALNVALQPVSFGGPVSSDKKRKGIIAGATVGALALVGLIAGICVLLYRRREQGPKGSYNRADRIERLKPTTYTSDSVLEPLSQTVHRDMHDMRNQPGTTRYMSSDSIDVGELPGQVAVPAAGTAVPYGVVTPFVVQSARQRDVDADSDAVSTVLSRNRSSDVSRWMSSSGGRSAASMSPPPVPDPKAVVQQEELRSEVDNLRREIERIREETAVLGEAPPSYDADLMNSLRTTGSP